MALKLSFEDYSAVSVSLGEAIQALTKNISKLTRARQRTLLPRIERFRERVSQHDNVWAKRAMQLVSLSDALMQHEGHQNTCVFDLFSPDYFKLTGYFEQIPQGYRPPCHYCREDLSKGYNFAIAEQPIISGADCLQSVAKDFGGRSRAGEIKSQMLKVKKEKLEARSRHLFEKINEHLGKGVSYDMLSGAMKEEILHMSVREKAEYRRFKKWEQQTAKEKDAVLEEYGRKLEVRLKERITILNALPMDTALQFVQAELQKTSGKRDLLTRLVGSELVDEETRNIALKAANSTEEVTAAEFDKLALAYRMFFPINVEAFYGTIIRNLQRRHNDCKLRDEQWLMIKPLMDKYALAPKQFLASGLECIRLRYADPEDIVAVAQQHNHKYLQQLIDAYGIDPVRALRERLQDVILVGNMLPIAEANNVRFLLDKGSAIAEDDIERHTMRFTETLCSILPMDEFEERMKRLSAAARKEAYQRHVNPQYLTSDHGILDKVYISLDDFVGAASSYDLLDDVTAGRMAENLGVSRTPKNFSESLALAIIERVANTYADDPHYAKWLENNRTDLLKASGERFRLMHGSKEFLAALFRNYEKVADVRELSGEERQALKLARPGKAGSIRPEYQPFAGDLEYAKA